MIPKWNLFLVAGCLALSAGCFRQVQEERTEDQGAQISLRGSGAPVSLWVDGEVVVDSATLDESDGIRYRIDPGTHEIEVRRGGTVLVRRRLYIGEGETRILDVPEP
jgi:hypothetical protein